MVESAQSAIVLFVLVLMMGVLGWFVFSQFDWSEFNASSLFSFEGEEEQPDTTPTPEPTESMHPVDVIQDYPEVHIRQGASPAFAP